MITISGRVYETTPDANPLIADALVEVTGGDGVFQTTHSSADGFYSLMVRGGNQTVTASKDGYESKTWQFSTRHDIVLNFSLSPL